MHKPILFVFPLALLVNVAWPGYFTSQGSSVQKPRSRENTSSNLAYSSLGSSDHAEYSSRTSQYQKLIDEKNYELNTTIRVPSINGGERVDREISEKSQKINENQFKLERVIRATDTNGRLSSAELVEEDHQLKNSTEEIQRTLYRPEINGKMVPQTVEKETIVTPSKRETLSTRAIYRPNAEGRFALTDLEESSEKKISDTISVRDTVRKATESNGRLALVGNTKETTTKLTDKSFRKESSVHKTDENGRLLLTDKVVETQTEKPDGTKFYQKLLESRNVHPQVRNVDDTGLILSQRITGEERKLPDGTIENTVKVETLDGLAPSSGLRLSEIITEISRPAGNGKIAIERVVKTRDVNGNYVVLQKVSEILEQKK